MVLTKKQKIYSILGLSILSLALVSFATYKVNQFFEKHQFVFQSPVVMQTPVYLIPRVLAQTINVVKADNLPLNDNEKYLCQKFSGQCRIALEIQRRENGTEQCDRWHVNADKSIDFGFMQINSVHLNKNIKLADLIDCKKNIDIAFDLYSKQGWGIWASYKLIK